MMMAILARLRYGLTFIFSCLVCMVCITVLCAQMMRWVWACDGNTLRRAIMTETGILLLDCGAGSE